MLDQLLTTNMHVPPFHYLKPDLWKPDKYEGWSENLQRFSPYLNCTNRHSHLIPPHVVPRLFREIREYNLFVSGEFEAGLDYQRSIISLHYTRDTKISGFKQGMGASQILRILNGAI
jgi:hypothetical protein